MEALKLKKMGEDCLNLIIKKMNKGMTSEEFYISLMELHDKYPIRGHSPSLDKGAILNYKEREIYPKNFKEAAEMYIRSAPERVREERGKDGLKEDSPTGDVTLPF